MISSIVFVPAAPLMCPDVDVESLLADERAASIELISELQQSADLVVVVGAGDNTTWFEEGGIGNTRAFGGVGSYLIGTATQELPQALTVGASVVSAAGWSGKVKALLVDKVTTSEQRRVLADELVKSTEDQQALIVVVGDGSATRTEKAPGYIQPDAVAFDESLIATIEGADPQALLNIDQITANRLWCRGLPAWQVIANACVNITPGFQGTLVLQSSPFGVNYFVASWRV